VDAGQVAEVYSYSQSHYSSDHDQEGDKYDGNELRDAWFVYFQAYDKSSGSLPSGRMRLD